MKIVIDRNVFVRGELYSADPKPVDLPEAAAKELIALGKAHAVNEPAAPEPPATKKAPSSKKTAQPES